MGWQCVVNSNVNWNVNSRDWNDHSKDSEDNSNGNYSQQISICNFMKYIMIVDDSHPEINVIIML